MKKITISFYVILLTITILFPFKTSALEKGVVISEIESDAPDKGNDWVEIVNTSSQPIDISGWYLTDDKGNERKTEGKTIALKENTILDPGAYLVFEETIDFNFGFGKSDTAILFDKDGNQVASYTYTSVASGTWSLQDDGTFKDVKATKGSANAKESALEPSKPETKSGLVLNEINSSPDDWIEIMNLNNETLDISLFEIRDNSDDHIFRFKEGSVINANALMVIDASSEGLIYDNVTNTYVEGRFDEAIGIGSLDSIRLYDNNGNLIDEYSWDKHASYNGDETLASYGRYPDGTGSFCLTLETKNAFNKPVAYTIAINEVESNGDATDWVEVINTGLEDVDISGWYLLDNDPVGHKNDVTPVLENTILKPGELYVFEQNKDFTFGLGKNDEVTLFNSSGVAICSYKWEGHANGVYARIPDGTGAFVDFKTATKGKKNKIVNPVVINEIQSNDPSGNKDWVELANPTDQVIDISGLVMKDEKDKDAYTIPQGTTIEANGFLVIYHDDKGETGFAFGLGKGDSVRLFEDGEQIAIASWPKGSHTNPTWGLYPDVHGKTYKNTLVATINAPNKFADIPDTIKWPGDNDVKIFDTTPTFLEDSSGLDFYDGKLYAVDNGTATFWILNVNKDGTLTLDDDYKNGKQVAFKKDKDNVKAKGPDAEGISVDNDGYVYLASERDNSAKGVNYNVILMVDPNKSDKRLVALNEWDLTNTLPSVSANMGIEAVEWVSFEDIDGKLIDQNTNKAFDKDNYPNAISSGIFFVALEDNGHVYAYVLNKDETAIQIADIDSKLNGAMALDYDTYEKALWVASDDGYNNLSAKIKLNGTINPEIVHVLPAEGLDKKANNEGFAIASKEYTLNGQRPVYHFRDGVTSNALTIGSLDCDYVVNNKDKQPISAGPKDKNKDGIISCEEETNSKNWIWSNTKKACVYKVSNTKAR